MAHSFKGHHKLLCVIALLAWLVSAVTWGHLASGERSKAQTNHYALLVLVVALLLMAMGGRKKGRKSGHKMAPLKHLALIVLAAAVVCMFVLMYKKDLTMDQRMKLMKAHLGLEFIGLALFALVLPGMYKHAVGAM